MFILGVIGLVCQYHSHVIGRKKLVPKMTYYVSSGTFLCISLVGFLVFILVVVGLFCQYHSQVIGWKDSSPK